MKRREQVSARDRPPQAPSACSCKYWEDGEEAVDQNGYGPYIEYPSIDARDLCLSIETDTTSWKHRMFDES